MANYSSLLKKYLTGTLLCLCLALLAGSLAPAALAQSGAIVRIAPPQAQVQVGQTADVVVEIEAVEGLYGMDIALEFDPAAVEVLDADPLLDGIQVGMGTFLDPGFVLRNEADNTLGRVRFAMTQLNPSTPKSGSGVLIVLRLQGKQLGAISPLTLVRVLLGGPGGASIEATTESGQVQVVQTISGPTSTPVPTQGAGTPLPAAAPPTETPVVLITAVEVGPTLTPIPTNTAPPPTAAVTEPPVLQPASPTAVTNVATSTTAAQPEQPTQTPPALAQEASPTQQHMAAAQPTPTPLPAPAAGQTTQNPGLTWLLLFGLAVLIGVVLWIVKFRYNQPTGPDRG